MENNDLDRKVMEFDELYPGSRVKPLEHIPPSQEYTPPSYSSSSPSSTSRSSGNILETIVIYLAMATLVIGCYMHYCNMSNIIPFKSWWDRYYGYYEKTIMP